MQQQSNCLQNQGEAALNWILNFAQVFLQIHRWFQKKIFHQILRWIQNSFHFHTGLDNHQMIGFQNCSNCQNWSMSRFSPLSSCLTFLIQSPRQIQGCLGQIHPIQENHCESQSCFHSGRLSWNWLGVNPCWVVALWKRICRSPCFGPTRWIFQVQQRKGNPQLEEWDSKCCQTWTGWVDQYHDKSGSFWNCETSHFQLLPTGVPAWVNFIYMLLPPPLLLPTNSVVMRKRRRRRSVTVSKWSKCQLCRCPFMTSLQKASWNLTPSVVILKSSTLSPTHEEWSWLQLGLHYIIYMHCFCSSHVSFQAYK